MKNKKSAKLLRTELYVAHLLRFGVLICGGIVIFGLCLTWLNPTALNQFARDTLPHLASGAEISNVSIPKTPAEVISGVSALHPNAVIALGLLLLIALPIIRVGSTVVLFLMEKDYLYFGITLFVFCVLLSGIILGKAL